VTPGFFLDRDPLDFIERNLVLSPIIKLGCPWRFVVRDLLRNFQLTAVLQIRRDTGRAEGVITNPRFDAGRFCPSADNAVGVLLERGLVVSWPVLRRAVRKRYPSTSSAMPAASM